MFKSDIRTTFMVQKISFEEVFRFVLSVRQRILKKTQSVTAYTKMLSNTTAFKIANKKFFLSSKSTWFLKDHVTLKIGVMMLKIKFWFIHYLWDLVSIWICCFFHIWKYIGTQRQIWIILFLKGTLQFQYKFISLSAVFVSCCQLTVRKTRPPLVTVAMTDKQCRSHTTLTFSCSEKYIAEQRVNWQNTDREDSRLLLIWNKVSGPSGNSNNKYVNVLWLFNVSWHITVLPQFKHVNRSSFHIYLKHEMNMNKHQKVFYFNRGTHHFSSLSPPKLIYSSVWFVVKARRDTAAAGHAHLHIFPSRHRGG